MLSVRPTSLNAFYHLSLFPRFCRYFVTPIRTIHLLAKSPVNINATVRGMIITQESGRKRYLPLIYTITHAIARSTLSSLGVVVSDILDSWRFVFLFFMHSVPSQISSRVFIASIIRRFHVHQGTTCISKLRYILQITTGKIFQQNKTFQSFA